MAAKDRKKHSKWMNTIYPSTLFLYYVEWMVQHENIIISFGIEYQIDFAATTALLEMPTA